MLEAALAGALPGGVVGTSEAARSAGLASGASGSQSVGPVSRVLAGLGEGEPSGPETGAADGLAADRSDAGAANASSPSPSPAGDAVHRAAAERQAAELLGDVDFSARRGVCSFDTPKGTKCKACGKKH